MPATDNYPANLPDFIVSKTRTKVEEYLLSDDDALINSELITRNDIVHFNVDVICVIGCEDEPKLFEEWIFTNPSKPFNKTIVTEFGSNEYNVVITEMPADSVQVGINAYKYSFVIAAERLLTDLEMIDRTLAERYALEAQYIDVAVNKFWPEV